MILSIDRGMFAKEQPMSKPNNRAADFLALAFILPFAAGAVHAADPAKTGNETVKVPMAEKQVPPPTIDTDKDGKADAWDRDNNGIPDAWDLNGDGKPDALDNNGDGKPDESKAPPPPSEPERQ
jgi:hypothetical protein